LVAALAVQENGDDPLEISTREQLTAGAASAFSMPMMHDVKCDYETISTMFPASGSKSAQSVFSDAQRCACQLVTFVANKKAKREAKEAARQKKKLAKKTSSSAARESDV
jgi:hypothetical protein